MEVKIFDVDRHKLSVLRRHHIVKEVFGGGKVRGWGANVVFVVDPIPAYGEPDSSGVSLVGLVGLGAVVHVGLVALRKAAVGCCDLFGSGAVFRAVLYSAVSLVSE